MTSKTRLKKPIIIKVIFDWKGVNIKFPNQDVKELEAQEKLAKLIKRIGKNLKYTHSKPETK